MSKSAILVIYGLLSSNPAVGLIPADKAEYDTVQRCTEVATKLEREYNTKYKDVDTIAIKCFEVHKVHPKDKKGGKMR